MAKKLKLCNFFFRMILWLYFYQSFSWTKIFCVKGFWDFIIFLNILGQILSCMSVDFINKYICLAHHQKSLSQSLKKVKTLWDFNDASANYCLTHITGIWVEHCCNWVLLIASWFFLEPLWSLKPLNSILLSEQKICSWIKAFLYVQVLPKTSLTIIIVQYLFDLVMFWTLW